jgi:hypothetical protein
VVPRHSRPGFRPFLTMRVEPDTGTALEAPLVDRTDGSPRGTAVLVGAAGRVAIAWMTAGRVEPMRRCF